MRKKRKYFAGVTFMVDGKMCISVGHDEMMCRIDPAIREEVIQKEGCRTVKDYVLITAEGMKTKKEFE